MSTARSSVDTPLMRQYLEVKERHPGCLVFFRVGDFYELFFDDAVIASRVIDLTLTTRDKGKEDPVPMAGVPHHAVQQYLGRLVERGYKVAICEQMEDPRLARGLVKREVTRIVTPGVIVDEEQLDARCGRYLAAVVEATQGVGQGTNAVAGRPERPGQVGLAWLDVSTGEFAATELPEERLDDELARIAPHELLLSAGAFAALRARTRTPITDIRPPGAASGVAAAGAGQPEAPTPVAGDDDALLEEAVALPVEEMGLGAWPAARTAAAACVRYARATQPAGVLPLARLVAWRPADHLVLDEATQSNLELFETLAERQREGALLGVLDETRTAPGARLLRRWLGAPLTDVAAIRRRHDAVEWLVDNASLRALVRRELDGVQDLERLVGRATLGVATPRDLSALRRSLERLPGLAASLADAAGAGLAPPELLRLGVPAAATSALAEDVARNIEHTLVDDPPVQWKDGGIVRRGCNAELDELCDVSGQAKDAILAIETRERERTGIGSLKVRYNRIFGYYIEISRSKTGRVPDGYVRKQTVANAERYTTAELTDYERKVLGAEERRLALEEELFVALRARVAEQARRILALAEQVALLDVAAALAEVAHASGYVRPEVDEGDRIEIDEGRHPVVERLVPGAFVPNDVRLDPAEAQLLVITGPNMAGKSTLMRQVALISLMAQMGGFVPATRARLGVVDRIFTRVGAADNLSRGESTFMLEMRETANILRHATRRSLLVLDEIGRGTSTYDGLSIAWAVAEHLHDRVGAKTLFATHYHELTALARSRPRVRNFQVAVREWKDEIVFLHQLVEGGASRSYGIQVARLAGLPRSVLERARQVLHSLEGGDELTPVHGPLEGAPTPQLSLFASPGSAPATAGAASSAAATAGSAAARVPLAPLTREEAEVLDSLRAAEPDELSPRAAHALLADLHARLSRP